MDDVPESGPIGLVGSGEFLPAMEAVDAELLAGRPPRAVVLPTAAALEGPARVDHWIELARAHYRRLGVDPVPLLVRDRSDACDPALAGRVAGAGLVYLSGGNPGYLADTLRDTPVWEAIMAAWSAGAALAGCSAGAMALTVVADDVRVRPPLPRPGLGVVPRVAVLPHFDAIERWWPGAVEQRLAGLEPAEVLIGIDEDTALVGGPTRFTVRGRGRAWVIDRTGARHPHAPGDTVDVDVDLGLGPRALAR